MRRRFVIVAALVVAAAVACALVVRALADDEQSGSLGGTVVDSGACPAITEDQRDSYAMPYPVPGTPESIPPGAERVWMCQGMGSPLDVPADSLESDVDSVAELINELPEVSPGEPQECPADGGPGYRLRFQYADGAVADAVGQLYGCGNVQVGSTLHAGDRAGVALQQFIGLLREQRDGTEPPMQPAAPACVIDEGLEYTPVSPVSRPDEMTAAVICEGIGGGAGNVPESSAVIPDADLAVLLADHAVNRSDRPPSGRECRAGRNVSIIGATAWGDQVLMAGYCSMFVDVSTRPSEEVPRFWRPGPESRAIIDQLLGTDPVEVTACPVGPGVPLDAEGPKAEQGVVPLGATSVRLCLGPGNQFQEPADALVTQVDELAGVVNELEPLTSRACTKELGYGYRLVFSYPDATAIAVSGQVYGCEVVEVGGVDRAGATEPWRAFRDALRAQRNSSEPPGQGFGPTCRAPEGGQRSLLSPVALPTEMARAVVCVSKPNNSDRERRSRVSAAELALLLRDRAENADDDGPVDGACEADRRAFALKGVTAWGDRVELQGFCGLVADYGLLGEDTLTYWHPGPQAQTLLDRLYAEAEPLRRLD